MQNSANTPETAKPSAETREPTQNELDQVLSVLRGDSQDDQADAETQDQEAQADDKSEAGSETDKPKGKPKNLEDVAEALGVEVKELYNLEIPFAVGDDVEQKTLGQLKDSMTDRDSFEVDRLAWEESKTKRESELMRSTQELSEIVGMLPKSALSDDLLKSVARRRAETVNREERLTKQVIPEWSNEQVEERERSEMREHLSEYGFPNNYLDNLVDHRTLRYIRESMLREQRITKALEQVKTVRQAGHGPSGKPSKAKATSNAKGRPTSRNRSQIQKVAELLKTGS